MLSENDDEEVQRVRVRTMIKSTAAVALGGAALHATVVGGALLRSLWQHEHELPQPPAGESTGMAADRQSNVSSAILGTVLTMYSRGCVTKDSFAEHCVFDDPAARTQGFEELREAFRALRALEPETLDWRLGAVGAGSVEVLLWQRYTIGARKIELHSKIVAQHDSSGRIVAMQDRWRGCPLLFVPPFTWARRINGVISYHLTPFLNVPADDGS